VHPTDKRIVGLSCPNLYPAVMVFWEEAAEDFPLLNPTMPPVATKPPTSKTFLVLNNALFFALLSMITSSLRRDCVSRSLSFLLNVFIIVYYISNNARDAEEVPPVCFLLLLTKGSKKKRYKP